MALMASPLGASQARDGVLSPAPEIYAQLQGTWEGNLHVMGIDYVARITVHERAPDKPLQATLAIPQQVSMPLGAEVTVDSDTSSASFSIAALQASYEASLDASGNVLCGSWKQGGMSFPLEMTRTPYEHIMHIPRVQDPKEPYPYHVQEVTFTNHTEGIQLAGTFTYPKEGGPFPAVILVTGSGAHSRDMEIFAHRPFKVLADHLSRNGIAVLRYDDRGAGSSEGNPNLGNSLDFSRDTEAALDFLLAQNVVDHEAIGIIGISEGGMIAPMVAHRRDEVSFLVLMAAPGIPGDQLLMSQSEALMTAQGFPQEKIDAALAVNRAAYDLVLSPLEGEKLASELSGVMKQLGLSDAEIQGQVAMITLPWMRYYIAYDPSEVLAQTRIPVLVLQGDRDTQVIAHENVPAIEKALHTAGNTRYTVKVYPEMNHLFQPSATGLPPEYGIIDITMDQGVMEDISSWVRSTVK